VRRVRRSTKGTKRLTKATRDQLARHSLDLLEADNPAEAVDPGPDDGEYEFEDDWDDDEDERPRGARGGKRGASGRSSKSKRAKTAPVAGPEPHVARALGQRRAPRLADMLVADGIGVLDDEGGVSATAGDAVEERVRYEGLGSICSDSQATYLTSLQVPPRLPSRPHCELTGLLASYRNPSSGKPFHSLKQAESTATAKRSKR
jgi:hypothetical protein